MQPGYQRDVSGQKGPRVVAPVTLVGNWHFINTVFPDYRHSLDEIIEAWATL